MKRNLVFVAGGVLLGAVSVFGFEAAKGLLYPNMTAEKGTWDAPAGKLGVAPETPWTASTVAAGVDGKPLEGKAFTAVGEVVDYSCYLQVGKHGGKHRDCGQKCVRNGQPAGLLLKDGTLYLLIDEEHNPRRDGQTNLRDALVENMAYIVEVTGTLSEVNGQRAIFVQGFVKK
jgi:hypothetical protein